MNCDVLVNKGAAVISDPSESAPRTIVVVGVARGGTSIVAGALTKLGLPMGERCHEPVFEDLRLSQAFEGQSEEAFEDVVAAYNAEYEAWGWKRPSTISQLDKLEQSLRNPHFIFVFRDLFSIANRNAISMKQDVKVGLQKALDDYGKIVGFLQRSLSPIMLVSSDKVVRHKRGFIEQLTGFAGLEPGGEEVEAALKFISPDPADYLDKTRITKARGAVNLDVLRKGVLRGWARAVHHALPVVVEVEVNGEVLVSTEASIYREYLKKPGIHPTGECGFELDLRALNVIPSDVISVRAVDDVRPLHANPIQFPELDRWMTPAEWRAAKLKDAST
ncbi:hypothetical protein KUV22_08810 [Microbulbifer agarilyticus]|uniref:hypothetical protein n=1 Tax=Microbulbifer agarilyticus TaxID=260552 RepID=UPI001C97EF24|nr:hypothetical protein [Microbulbifer agarilyticus]MBY6190513.1 hypothetical protein [Microbulbifer agarilyticus]